MPIVFEDYFRSSFPNIADSIDIVYASIRESDLSRFGCKKTVAIKDIIGGVKAESGLVVVGGEVLCARNESLFIHAQSSTLVSNFLTWLKRHSKRTLRFLAGILYSCPWKFSYIPEPRHFVSCVNVAYNSVGGALTSDLMESERDEVLSSLGRSVHFSVRDQRTYNSFSSFVDTYLVPDSVILLSSLYELEDLESKLSPRLRQALPERYIVLQAAPEKASGSLIEVATQVDRLAKLSGMKIVLLPIGYATGHDDLLFLKKVHDLKPEVTTILSDLSIWEILYTIAKAKVYYGTSLHGAITAMSYNVPHFGLNPKIRKLDEYLKCWSVEPFNGCIDFSEISGMYQPNYDDELKELHARVREAQQLTRTNIGMIIGKLFP